MAVKKTNKGGMSSASVKITFGKKKKGKAKKSKRPMDAPEKKKYRGQGR